MAQSSIYGTNSLGVGPQYSPYVGTQVAPTMGGTTNYGALGGGASAPQPEYTDQFGNRFRYVDYGNDTGEWMQVMNNGQLARPQDVEEIQRRQAGTSIAGNGSGALPAGATRAATPRQTQIVQQGQAQNAYSALANDTSQSKNFDAQNSIWQNAIGGAVGASIAGRNGAAAQQNTDTGNYVNALNGLTQQRQGYVDQANASDYAALGQYNTQAGQQYNAISALQAPTWQNYSSNPQDVARQQQSYDWASGVSGGSLDYQAAQAALSQSSYQGYTPTSAQYEGYNAENATYETYQAKLAELFQYASNPEDVQRQLSGLSDIQKDIATGGDGQRKILAQIYQDLQSGGDGQRDAIERLKQELSTGGNDQREVMEKYKALSDPKVTAQERYLAEIARRSFEAQDKGNREAVLSGQAARGVRSGSAEIASALGNQERFGQDRTLAELGLQANAVGRSMQALGGWQQSADSLRAAQQNGLAMFTQAQNALRAAQQQGMGMAADEENALRQAQQQGLAMYQQAADSIRAMNDQVGLANTGWANENSMFNANSTNNARAFNANAHNVNNMFNTQQNNTARQFNANAFNENSMFNANSTNQANQFNANAYNQNSMFNAGQANQVSMYNAGQTNNAYANNQSTRMQGGALAASQANSIRSSNDAIGMFNTQGSQTSQQFAAQFGLAQQGALNGLTQQGFNNTTGTNATTFGRNTGQSDFSAGAAGSIFGAQTTNNGIQGGVGSQNLGDLLGGYGAFTTGSGISTGLHNTETSAQMSDAALRRLGPRPGSMS